ncbi:MAG: DUF420 domain-containing protein, partial [Verrucomicrobiota bacterium]|nr:DUF420 domain-containing protein [Verrucomicrobiota bacterium]
MNQLDSYRSREANMVLARKLKIGVWIVTAVVLLLVGLMRQVKIGLPEGMSFDFLPPLHALLNTCAATALILSVLSIRKGKVDLHRRWIY